MRGSKFLMATLASGVAVVAEFSRLNGSGQGYASQVFSGRKPFNAWRVVGSTHPHSGEAVLVRSREMYNGSEVVKVAQVRPLAGREETHNYDPANFEIVQEMQKGQYGMWTAPTENTPEGAVAGAAYPIHREPESLRRYAILKVAQGEDAERRFYLDGQDGAGVASAHDERDAAGPGDGDEDGGDGEDAEW